MKTKLFLFLFVAFLTVACGKKNVGQDNGTPQPYPPKTGQNEIHFFKSIFMDPVKINTKQSDTRIMDSLIRYVQHTPKDETIHVNIFLFSYKPLITALTAAYERGVTLHLLVDNGRDESEKENRQSIIDFLSLLKSPSRIVTVISDASATSINHNKYVLFTKVALPEGFARNVVFSTSHNFITAGTKKIQDATVISNAALYRAFLDNWNDMAGRAKSGMKNFSYKVVDMDSIAVHFFPRRKNGVWDGQDTYIEILDKITDYSSANVRVVMSDWSRVEVAAKLTELQLKGVRVEVIAKDKSDAGVLEELDRLKAAGGYVKVIKMAEKNTHSKITLISGTWDGKKQDLVFTGSHNYTYNALRNNNEVLLKIDRAKTFEEYNTYFDELKRVL